VSSGSTDRHRRLAPPRRRPPGPLSRVLSCFTSSLPDCHGLLLPHQMAQAPIRAVMMGESQSRKTRPSRRASLRPPSMRRRRTVRSSTLPSRPFIRLRRSLKFDSRYARSHSSGCVTFTSPSRVTASQNKTAALDAPPCRFG